MWVAGIRFALALGTVVSTLAPLPLCAAALSSEMAAQPESGRTEVNVTLPAAKVKQEVRRVLGDGSSFNVESKDGERHLVVHFNGLDVECGDLKVTGTAEADGKSGKLVVSSSSPITLTVRVTGHNADQKQPPSSTVRISVQSISATIPQDKSYADVTVPVEVQSSDLFIPYTDAKNQKILLQKTTTRAWAGPRPFKVGINLSLRVTVLDGGKGAAVEVLGWSPKDKSQAVEIGGWVRLPALLSGFNPDLAGRIQPLDEPKVDVKIEEFGSKTISNPLLDMMGKVKGKKFQVKP